MAWGSPHLSLHQSLHHAILVKNSFSNFLTALTSVSPLPGKRMFLNPLRNTPEGICLRTGRPSSGEGGTRRLAMRRRRPPGQSRERRRHVGLVWRAWGYNLVVLRECGHAHRGIKPTTSLRKALLKPFIGLPRPVASCARPVMMMMLLWIICQGSYFPPRMDTAPLRAALRKNVSVFIGREGERSL